MLEKKITYDHQITEDGHIHVRKITRVMEDGVEIAKQYHRSVISPGDSTVQEDDRTKKIATAIHTQDVIDEYTGKLVTK